MMRIFAAYLWLKEHLTSGGSAVAGEDPELADWGILCPQAWPTSEGVLSQQNRWASGLKAVWPCVLIKAVSYKAKFSPTLVPTAVHTELIHFQLGRNVTAHLSLSGMNFPHKKEITS